MEKETPKLFGLMTQLSAAARQKIGERRRALKSLQRVEERLQEKGKGEWSLEYWKDGKKIDQIDLERAV